MEGSDIMPENQPKEGTKSIPNVLEEHIESAGGKFKLPELLQDLTPKEQRMEVEEKAKEIHEETKKEEASFLGELFESFLKRYFPTGGKIVDLFRYFTNLKEELKRPETYALEHEFEILTALTMFIPDGLLSYITDPIASMIGTIDKELGEAIKKDPDVFFSKLREWVQHYATGKIGVGKIGISEFIKEQLTKSKEEKKEQSVS